MKGLILPPDRAANMQNLGKSYLGCDVAMPAGEKRPPPCCIADGACYLLHLCSYNQTGRAAVCPSGLTTANTLRQCSPAHADKQCGIALTEKAYGIV
jgi:hypothetical protein